MDRELESEAREFFKTNCGIVTDTALHVRFTNPQIDYLVIEGLIERIITAEWAWKG